MNILRLNCNSCYSCFGWRDHPAVANMAIHVVVAARVRTVVVDYEGVVLKLPQGVDSLRQFTIQDPSAIHIDIARRLFEQACGCIPSL